MLRAIVVKSIVERLAIETNLPDRETQGDGRVAIRFRIIDINEHPVRERRDIDFRRRIANDRSSRTSAR